VVPASAQLILGLAQLGLHPSTDGDALEHEAPVSGLRADVLGAEKVERLRLGLSARPSILRGEAPKLNHPACTCPCQRFTDALTNASA
jgi:hypothetical protein